MKKIFTLFLAIAFTFGCACADAQFTAAKQNIVNLDDSPFAYYFAVVENTGDTAGYIGSYGLLECFDAEGSLIISDGDIYAIPFGIMLKPGEHTFVYGILYDDALTGAVIASTALTFDEGAYGNDYEMTAIPAAISITDDYFSELIVSAEYTNTSESTARDFTIVCAVYDAEGNIRFVSGDTYYDLGVNPGSTITAYYDMDGGISESIDAGSCTAEAYVYITK